MEEPVKAGSSHPRRRYKPDLKPSSLPRLPGSKIPYLERSGAYAEDTLKFSPRFDPKIP